MFLDVMFLDVSKDEEAEPVMASESSETLEALFTIAYAHPDVPKSEPRPLRIIKLLCRAAEKYQMHGVLQHLSSLLISPHIEGNKRVVSLIKSLPLPSLALCLAYGFTLEARLALRRYVMGRDMENYKDEDLDDLYLGLPIIRFVQSERRKRVQWFRSRVEGWDGCYLNDRSLCHRAPWHAAVYRAVEDEPSIENILRHVQMTRTCPSCCTDVTSRNLTQIMTLIQEARDVENIVPSLPPVSPSIY